jgi:hypothetical protein
MGPEEQRTFVINVPEGIMVAIEKTENPGWTTRDAVVLPIIYIRKRLGNGETSRIKHTIVIVPFHLAIQASSLHQLVENSNTTFVSSSSKV